MVLQKRDISKKKLYILKRDTNPYEDEVMLKVVSKINSEKKTDC